MNYLDSCQICDSTQLQVRYPASFIGTVADAPPYFLAGRKASLHGQIMRCKNCGLVFTNPQFSREEYQEIYRRAARGRSLQAGLDEAELIRGKRLAKILTPFIQPGSTLLDFGCGEGGFLQAVPATKKCGIEVVELDGHKFLNATIYTGDLLTMLDEGRIPRCHFDVITALDVFEHLAEPERYMQALLALLKPGGLLFVTLPNVESLPARIFGARWGMFLLEHLWYFTPHTLTLWLKKFQLKCISTGAVPYDVPLGHALARLSQIFSVSLPSRKIPFSSAMLPLPVGLMYGVFVKEQ